jgi:hypothetical protein
MRQWEYVETGASVDAEAQVGTAGRRRMQLACVWLRTAEGLSCVWQKRTGL